MTEDNEFAYVDSLRARIGEPLWSEVVEFVAEWLEHQADVTIDGYSAQAMMDRWREEMA